MELHRVCDTWSKDLYDINYVTGWKWTQELDRVVDNDTPLFILAILSMSIACCMVLGKATRTGSRIVLGLMAIVSVLLAVGTGFGVAAWLRFPFSPIHSVLPFLIVGIGLDDAFIIVGAQKAQSVRLCCSC